MSKELELWKRISRCEVPGLTVRCAQFEVSVHHDKGDHDWAQDVVYYDGKPSKSRAAAMLVVDALEATGIAFFERVAWAEPRGVTWTTREATGEREDPWQAAGQHEGKEHLALLALLAEVCEAL